MNAAVNMPAAEWIVRYLEARGTHTVFGIPGGAVLPLYHALEASHLVHVLARHEQAAGFMAAGQARLSGRAGVFVVSSGPGATNAVTALADAYMDSIPLVCIAGQVPTGVIGTQAFQEVATVDMARPITKASLFAGTVDDLVRLLPEAFALAESGRRGPVLIDVPKDVQNQRVPAHALLALSSAVAMCLGFCLLATVLRSSVNLSPTRGDDEERLAFDAITREDLPRAEKLLRAAIALNPKRADAWHNLGYVLATTGRGPESEAAFGKAAELNASGR